MGRIVISAMGEGNRVIGKEGGGLPWEHLPDEYDHFLAKTRGHPVIMGKNTYKLLVDRRGNKYEVKPDSKMFVVSKSLAEEGKKEWEGAEVCKDLDEAMDRAQKLDRDYFFAGGASIYKEVMDRNLADTLFLSEVKGSFAGTAYFPEVDEKIWKEVSRDHHPGWDFIVYKIASK